MASIVDVIRHMNRKGWLLVLLDDGSRIAVTKAMVSNLKLRQGLVIDKDNIKQLAQQADVDEAYNRALRYLGYRARSQKEIEDYLYGKEFSSDTISLVIQKLVKYKLLDDYSFAKQWVESRMNRRASGRKLLKFELINKGVSDNIIEQVLGSISREDEEEQAKRLAIKLMARHKARPDGDRERRVARTLAQRGFDWEIIRGAINTDIDRE